MSELVFLLSADSDIHLLSADSDIQIAYEFCDAYQAGRGEVLMRHLDAAFGRLREFPEVAPLFHKAFRRLLVHGFPYGIFYSIEGRRIIISGVMDLRQDPTPVRKRRPAAAKPPMILEMLQLRSAPRRHSARCTSFSMTRV